MKYACSAWNNDKPEWSRFMQNKIVQMLCIRAMFGSKATSRMYVCMCVCVYVCV
jgi:hypothetical protein